MYMDCGFDGDEPERGKVVDHTPTEEEWKKILACFPDGKTGQIVRALKSAGNTPLEKDINPAVTRGRIGGMNTALIRAKLPFRLTPTFKGGPWDNIRLERQDSPAEPKRPDPPEERIMRCCP